MKLLPIISFIGSTLIKANNGAIHISLSFKADEFSPYVVVFVKDGNKTVNFVLKDVDDPEGDDLSDSRFEDIDAISLNDTTVDIQNLVQGYDLDEIEIGSNRYIYQYATTENNVDADHTNAIERECRRNAGTPLYVRENHEIYQKTVSIY